jgi:hypothetical protein
MHSPIIKIETSVWKGGCSAKNTKEIKQIMYPYVSYGMEHEINQ